MKGRIPLTMPTIDQEMIESAMSTLHNEKLVMGESVYKFEEEFARYIGTKFAISTNSGTSALDIIFEAIKIKGKSVVVPSATFISTVNGAVCHGALPIFGDIDMDSYTIDPEHIEYRLNSSDVGVVIPVHLYGNPADLQRIMDTCSDKDVMIVEDAAQAHGATVNGRKVGSFGHLSIFSFYPTKNMTVGGDGGAIVTNDEDLADKLRKLRDVGRVSRYKHEMIGHALRLNSVNAAIGRIQLRKLDSWNDRRREIAHMYDKVLSRIEEIVIPSTSNGKNKHVYHLYVIRVLNGSRNALGAWLSEHNVEVLMHYPIPVHEQTAYAEFNGSFKLANTEEWTRSILSIPMFPGLRDEQVNCISELIIEFFEKSLYKDKEAIQKGQNWYNQLI